MTRNEAKMDKVRRWREICLEVMLRANWRCEELSGNGKRCTKAAGSVHHVHHLGMGGSRYDPDNPLNELENLRALCGQHHRAKHGG
jgi:hypothetical protein